MGESQLKKEAQHIVNRYEDFLLHNKDNLYGHLLFAKFLQKVGQSKEAISLFFKADAIDPNLAVVKQQIGNFLVEEGKPTEAFPFFLLTIRLSPNEPAYHYQLGNFIFLFRKELSSVNYEGNLDLNALMHESFKEASCLEPANFDYALRFAQSYFDLEMDHLDEALEVWTKLSDDFGNRSDLEMDYIQLCRARILVSMQKFNDAKRLIQSVRSPSFDQEKKSLLEKASSTSFPLNEKKSSFILRSDTRPHSFSNAKLSFPSDIQLEKIHRVAQKFREERMLETFRLDVSKAKFLPTEELSLELAPRKKP